MEEGKKGIDVKQKLERPFGTAIGDGAPGMTGGAQDWRFGLPTLCGQGLCLREPTTADSKQLAALVTPDTAWRFTPRVPDSDADWARFVERLHADRAAGLSVCYTVIRDETAEVAGLIMVRRFELTFDIAECHFLFGETWRTSALPARSLGYVLDFAFLDIGLHRLEARSSIRYEGDVLRDQVTTSSPWKFWFLYAKCACDTFCKTYSVVVFLCFQSDFYWWCNF